MIVKQPRWRYEQLLGTMVLATVLPFSAATVMARLGRE